MKSEEHRHMNKINVKSTVFTTQLILFRDSHENSFTDTTYRKFQTKSFAHA